MRLNLKYFALGVGLIELVNTPVSMADDLESLGVTISGLVQVESRYFRDYEKTDTSEMALNEAGLVIDVQRHKWVSAHLAFIYEQESTPLEVDEAFITLGNFEEYPVSLTVGELYVPFGRLETNMVTDPLTLELAETRARTSQLGFKTGPFYGSVYAFNGLTDNKHNTMDHYGGNLGLADDVGGISYDLGVTYINDIDDTAAVSEQLDLEASTVDYDHVGGLSAYLVVDMQPISLIAEYVTALDEFKAEHIAFNGSGAKPQGWNIEAAYNFNVMAKDMTFALGYQGTDESVALGLPEQRYLGTISATIFDQTRLSLEYARDVDYNVSEGGTGNGADSVILQLAVEF